MGGITVHSKTQRIVVDQKRSVGVVNAGPPGPPGLQGIPGPPGVDAETSVELVMAAHVQAPDPHPAYDDMQDLATLFENGLF